MPTFLSFVLLLLPALAVAQAEFGIKGGLNISDIVMTNFVNPDVESDLRLKLGMHGGFYVSGMLDDRVGMTGELLYSDKGVKAPTNIHLHYVTMPLLIQYKMTDHIFAEVGPEPGYLFSAKSKHGDMSGTYSNKLDVALDGGFRFNSGRFLFGLRYCVGLFSVREPIKSSGPSGNETIKYQNRVLQFSLAYTLWEME